MYLLSDIFSFLGFITIPVSVFIFAVTMSNKPRNEKNRELFYASTITGLTIFVVIAALPITAFFFWISSLFN
jgi:membrane-associated HD superfamily phosphohydrolase